MFRIGLIDHYLDEWHANNYPRMLREEIARRSLPMEVSYGYADCDKEGGLSTDEWCLAQQCARVESIAEITARSDALIVLAPSYPEMHEEMARIPLSSGKPVYIDKIFAPDATAGKRIFELAKAGGTPLFSTSALRFGSELDDFRTGCGPAVKWCLTTGPNSFAVYAIHQMEMIQTVMRSLPNRVKAFGNEGGRTLLFDYGDGRTAQMAQMDSLPFGLTVSDGAQCENRPIKSDFFRNLIAAMVRFFEDGIAPVCPEDTLTALSMLSGGAKAMASADTWVSLR